MSIFGCSHVEVANTQFASNAIDLIIEPYPQQLCAPAFVDGGGNDCGSDACQTLSTGLAPPPPLP